MVRTQKAPSVKALSNLLPIILRTPIIDNEMGVEIGGSLISIL